MKVSRYILEKVGDKKQLAIIDYELGLISKAKNRNEESYKQLQDALSALERMGMKTWCEKCVNEFNN